MFSSYMLCCAVCVRSDIGSCSVSCRHPLGTWDFSVIWTTFLVKQCAMYRKSTSNRILSSAALVLAQGALTCSLPWIAYRKVVNLYIQPRVAYMDRVKVSTESKLWSLKCHLQVYQITYDTTTSNGANETTNSSSPAFER